MAEAAVLPYLATGNPFSMTYAQALDLLYTRLPMFSRIGEAAIKKDLTNTLLICEELGNPQRRFRSIHVAGTNGKGSVSHMLAAILQSCGYRTGLYTSPHLSDFRERIRVNGQMVPEYYVADFVRQHESLAMRIEPSFFEMTVAMAFDHFAQERVDVAVIETGLGGRLDSTNIITPELSVITNIGWDHMSLLGNTLPLIAAEKAGIIKPGIPALIGETQVETTPVFMEKATSVKAPLSFADQERYVSDWKATTVGMDVEVAENRTGERQFYPLDLAGQYQTRNLVTVLGAVQLLRSAGWQVPRESIMKGLSHVRSLTGLHGRWEKIHDHPPVILDVAHNTDGMKQVAAQIELSSFGRLHVVVGMVKDKDVRQVLSILPREARYYFTNAQIPRALPAGQLAEIGKDLGLEGETWSDVNTALKEALRHARKDDLVLVCGSFFIVGEVDRSLPGSNS
jgi:dihydrofolate synthase/folylpolyglutamate synthase